MTFIRPILEYASVVWSGAHQCDLDLLDKVQVRAMQIVTGCTRGTSHELLYKETGWLPLKDRRDTATLKLFYSCVINIAPPSLCNILPLKYGDISNYNLRNANDYIVPKYRLLCDERSFLPRTIKLWNALPEDIRSKPTISSFSYAINPQSLNTKRQSKQ